MLHIFSVVATFNALRLKALRTGRSLVAHAAPAEAALRELASSSATLRADGVAVLRRTQALGTRCLELQKDILGAFRPALGGDGSADASAADAGASPALRHDMGILVALVVGEGTATLSSSMAEFQHLGEHTLAEMRATALSVQACARAT